MGCGLPWKYLLIHDLLFNLICRKELTTNLYLWFRWLIDHCLQTSNTFGKTQLLYINPCASLAMHYLYFIIYLLYKQELLCSKKLWYYLLFFYNHLIKRVYLEQLTNRQKCCSVVLCAYRKLIFNILFGKTQLLYVNPCANLQPWTMYILSLFFCYNKILFFSWMLLHKLNI